MHRETTEIIIDNDMWLVRLSDSAYVAGAASAAVELGPTDTTRPADVILSPSRFSFLHKQCMCLTHVASPSRDSYSLSLCGRAVEAAEPPHSTTSTPTH